jgi:Flp pilus assembly protein TadG
MRSFPTISSTTKANETEKASARKRSRSHNKPANGHAVVEAALLFPCLVFLFVGAFDMGFYCYAMIGVENAARVAVEYTATSSYTASDSSTACTLALNELVSVPNMNGVTSCGSLPLKVAATAVSGPDGSPASQVSVQYQSSLFIPIPGLLTNQLNITRVAQMRIRS